MDAPIEPGDIELMLRVRGGDVAAFGALALCKPFVSGVQWVHLSDAQPHQIPHAGLVDVSGQVRPALDKLLRLREQHLR